LHRFQVRENILSANVTTQSLQASVTKNLFQWVLHFKRYWSVTHVHRALADIEPRKRSCIVTLS